MRKPMRRNTGRPAKKEPKPQDEVVRLLEDMNLTMNEILELLQRLEENAPKPEPKQPEQSEQQSEPQQQGQA